MNIINTINTVKMAGAILVVIGGALSAYILNSRAKCTLMHAEGMISILRHI